METTVYEERIVAQALMGSTSVTPEERLIRDEDRATLVAAIKTSLTLRERVVVRLRFGWHEEDQVAVHWNEVVPNPQASGVQNSRGGSYSPASTKSKKMKIAGITVSVPQRRRVPKTLVVHGRLGETATFEEIGRALGISPERVRQIIQQALVKLRGSIPAHCLFTMFS
jgi:RNA polymerase sigma factor (sigma-70 family)